MFTQLPLFPVVSPFLAQPSKLITTLEGAKLLGVSLERFSTKMRQHGFRPARRQTAHSSALWLHHQVRSLQKSPSPQAQPKTLSTLEGAKLVGISPKNFSAQMRQHGFSPTRKGRRNAPARWATADVLELQAVLKTRAIRRVLPSPFGNQPIDLWLERGHIMPPSCQGDFVAWRECQDEAKSRRLEVKRCAA